MPDRNYDGPDLDFSWQDIKDRPYKGEGETVYVTDPEPEGEMEVSGVPKLPESVDVEDVQAVVGWLDRVAKYSDQADPSGIFPNGDWTEPEIRAYQLGRWLVAEGALDKIDETIGLGWGADEPELVPND